MFLLLLLRYMYMYIEVFVSIHVLLLHAGSCVGDGIFHLWPIASEFESGFFVL